MFDLEPFKHPDHRDRRAHILTIEDLCTTQSEERTLPYFSISIEQYQSNEGYKKLCGQDQGDFLRLLPIIWRVNGLLQDFGKAIARELALSETIWMNKRTRFIEAGLLEECPNKIYLLNRGLRQQFLNTLKTANSRRRTIADKSQKDIPDFTTEGYDDQENYENKDLQDRAEYPF